jgi:predicted adenylyl cyclase CyaB
MPTNLEVKIPLISFNEIKKRLNELNAEFKGEIKQKDIYFSAPKGLLKLRKQKDTQELIRYNRNEKGNIQRSDYDKISVPYENCDEILKNIFDFETIVEKKRLLYVYNNTRIHLDTVKNLGKFIELETSVNSTKAEAQKRFKFLVKHLKLDIKNRLKLSYRDLMLAKE